MSKETLRDRVVIFFKGILMGLADIVPGVSGGTIALITGIYERLISAIKSFDLEMISSLLKGDVQGFKKSIRDVDFPFLIPLGFGIVASFLTASRVIENALTLYPTFTYAFFFGLILASAHLVYRRIDSFGFGKLQSGLDGFLFAFWIVGIEYFSLIHHPLMIFISGFIAICAMILPGISGSFILLLLGQYHYMLKALKSFDLFLILTFGAGAVLGISSFARLLSYFFDNYEDLTLAFLTGLMLGALRLPLENIIYVTDKFPELNFVWTQFNLVLTFLFGILGLALVLLIDHQTKDLAIS